MPVAELQVDVEGLPVAGLGFGEPPLLLGDPAELVVGDALAFSVAGGLIELEFGLVVGLASSRRCWSSAAFPARLCSRASSRLLASLAGWG